MRGIRRAFLLSASLALLPALSTASDDPYADYRIPEHYWRSWTASLMANGDRNVGPGAFRIESIDATLGGIGTTFLSGGYDSDTRSSAYGLSLVLQGTRHHAESHGDDASQILVRHIDDLQRNQDASEHVAASYAFSHFPWTAPLGFALGANGSLTLGQDWNTADHVESQPPSLFTPSVLLHSAGNSAAGDYIGHANLVASLGWGRVRDATPVYQVQVLELRLLDLGTIQRPLSAAARERLAALYTVQSDLSFAHQRPTKYFWGELERLLREDGVLTEAGLDAYAVQRLLEPLTVGRSRFARTRGFSVGPQVMLTKNWRHVSQESSSLDEVFVDDTLFASSTSNQPRTRTNRIDDSILSGASIEYHRPYGMRWQLDAFSRGLISESGERLQGTTTIAASWMVSDRWALLTDGSWSLSAPGHGWDRHVDQWSVNAAASLNYFFEDAWAFQIGANHEQGVRPLSGYTRVDAFSIGVTFQFAGFLNAPGLFQPMRLSPPSN